MTQDNNDSNNANQPKKQKSQRVRQHVNGYQKSIRWAAETDYLDKLSPADKDYMLRFLESEYGGNAHLFYEDGSKECKKANARRQRLIRDKFPNTSLSDTAEPQTRSPEDALNRLIDTKHILHAEEREEAKKAAVKKRKDKLDRRDKVAKSKRKSRKAKQSEVIQ